MTREEQWLLEEKYGGDANTPGFEADKHRLVSGEPVAYIIGWQPFLGLRIYLDSRPLIPRPETEWWTQQLLTELRGQRFANINPLHVLDLCAGSGTIGCAVVANLPQAHVNFGEVDAAHKSTIEKNIILNGLDLSRVNIYIGDLFDPFGHLRFDVIVANPPYIPVGRKLPASVTQYEPSEALYAGPDGLDTISRIITELPQRLTSNGMAWIEIDNSQVNSVKKLVDAVRLHSDIRTDQYGRPRLVVVSF